jgi:hypothetical protein
LATEFAALREVIGAGNTEIGVLRDAVRAYIQEKTRTKAFREQYEAALARLMAAKPLRVVADNSESA